ncbi:MAG: 2-dehydro-3-deoxy-6-phosphogalactonate aldolase [Rhabdaerophilum sp.]
MTDHLTRFERALLEAPLIAILRGIRPDEVLAAGESLIAAGFRLIEVPLNSPDPFESIQRLVKHLGERAVIGAGTVRHTDEVRTLAQIGAGLVLSPHADPVVIRETVAVGLVSVPGILTPTEAFLALDAGAHALKLFPMEMIGLSGAKAMRAVLPIGTRMIAVGGVNEANAASLLAGGMDGLGLGSSLYKPGDDANSIRARAERFVHAMNA